MPDIDVDSLTWEPPPPVSRGQRSSKYDPIVEQLKANPGQWTQVLWNVNSASARVFIKKGCEITTRSTGDGSGRVNVWAMFPASQDAEATPSVPKTAAKKTTTKKAAASRPRARSKTKAS
jgi:hypothetical protein